MNAEYLILKIESKNRQENGRICYAALAGSLTAHLNIWEMHLASRHPDAWKSLQEIIKYHIEAA